MPTTSASWPCLGDGENGVGRLGQVHKNFVKYKSMLKHIPYMVLVFFNIGLVVHPFLRMTLRGNGLMGVTNNCTTEVVIHVLSGINQQVALPHEKIDFGQIQI